MNIANIQKLIEEKSLHLDIEACISLKIKDDIFRPGTVRVHLPAPINASWLKEGQLLDSEPFFRMASVEDYPQRSVYFNERLTENTPFSVKYAFTSEHTYVNPDIDLVDSTEQKVFSNAEIDRFSKNHHCGCESYTALPHDAVSILDVIEDRGIVFRPEYAEFLNNLSIPCTKAFKENSVNVENSLKNGSTARKIYDFITENFGKMNRDDHNIAFTAMCRMCGIPARWQGGWAVSDNNISNNAIAHDWAMVHLLPYGWIYVDCDFGAEAFHKKLSWAGTTTDIRLHDFFFGNIDPCMVPTASVPGADLYPAKDYERADKMFNIYGEVELVPDKLSSEGDYDGYGLKSTDFESIIHII